LREEDSGVALEESAQSRIEESAQSRIYNPFYFMDLVTQLGKLGPKDI
jgi:hypothetical protein